MVPGLQIVDNLQLTMRFAAPVAVMQRYRCVSLMNGLL